MTVHRLPGPCHVVAWPDGTRPPRFSVHIEDEFTAELTLAAVIASGAVEGRHRDCGGWAWYTPADGHGACIDCGCDIKPTGIIPSLPGLAQLTWYCHVAACDCGRCPPDWLMGEDDSIVHAATPDDLAIQAYWTKWRITADGHAYCPDSDLPAGAVLLNPMLPGDSKRAAQLTLKDIP